LKRQPENGCVSLRQRKLATSTWSNCFSIINFGGFQRNYEFECYANQWKIVAECSSSPQHIPAKPSLDLGSWYVSNERYGSWIL